MNDIYTNNIILCEDDIKDGVIVEKEILRTGEWIHPQDRNNKWVVKSEDLHQIVDNFNNKDNKPIPVPYGVPHPYGEHQGVLETKNNSGWVEDLSIKGDKLIARMKILAKDAAEKIRNGLIKNVSVYWNPYKINNKGKHIGTVVEHILLTNNPYLPELEPFKVLAEDESNRNIISIEQGDSMDLKEILKKEISKLNEAEIKFLKENVSKLSDEDKKKFDAVLIVKEDKKDDIEIKEKPVEKEEEAKKEDKKEDEKKDEKKTDGEQIKVENKDEKKVSMAEAQDILNKQTEIINKLKGELIEKEKKEVLAEAENKYDNYLKEGKIYPAQKELAVALLSNSEKIVLAEGESKAVKNLFEEFLSKQPKIALAEEKGKIKDGDEEEKEVLTEDDRKFADKYGISEKDMETFGETKTFKILEK